MGRSWGTGKSWALIGVISVVLPLVIGAPATANSTRELHPQPPGLRSAREALYERQLNELGMPPAFTPFLRSDAKVKTGREIFGMAAPDVDGDSVPEVFEVDLRYSYAVDEGAQGELPSVDDEVKTRIAVRDGLSGRKIWGKRYDEDAFPFAMRVGKKGRMGVLVIRGLWSWYGPASETHVGLDAFDGKKGRELWSREYRAVSSSTPLTWVTEDSPFLLAGFNGLRGKAHDLLLGLETNVSTLFTSTTATRVVVIDGRDGSETVHPTVDVGVDWWPIPLPVGDLDGDGLQDYATTNNPGVDLGEGQEEPSFGGTVYARKGTDGSNIWTTSGLEMDYFAFPFVLPDVVSDPTSEVAIETYRRNKGRVYLLDGFHGRVRWHKESEWIHSPGDLDGDNRMDVVLINYRVSFEKGRATFEQLALRGTGTRIWKRDLRWRFETAPCPEGICTGGYGLGADVSPDVQPDGVRDTLLFMNVQQNEAFNDQIAYLLNGRSGRALFKDDVHLQSPGVAIDGRGSDLIQFEVVANRLHVSARRGSSNRVLWKGILEGPEKLLPRSSFLWAEGFFLPGDGCGDLVVDLFDDDQTYYAVVDGASGKVLWSRWTGKSAEHPRLTHRRDRNPAC